MLKVFAIDPGTKQSAYVDLEIDGALAADGRLAYNQSSLKICSFGKEANKTVAKKLAERLGKKEDGALVVIERVAAMGMPVGYEIFETCEWIGRFAQIAEDAGAKAEAVYRLEEKITLCGDSKAKDANIRQSLVDRFARHDLKTGKGTKKEPDVFYGFYADVWSAMAVAVTMLEQKAGTGHKATWRR